MSNPKPKVIWEGPIQAYPFEHSTVRVVALRDEEEPSLSGLLVGGGFNSLECEIKHTDTLGEPSWALVDTMSQDDELDTKELEHMVFTAALLSMANKGGE